jgi:catechol 2,3-dioxygenase-like lactoylglutathione lyase family enzyme
MLYAGLDLSRRRLDFHLLDDDGATVELGSAPPDADGRAPGRAAGRDRPPLWIRVVDVDASTRFYERVAPHAGFRLGHARADFAHFSGAGGSFSLVAGAPTEHVHLAFSVAENADVDAFHRDPAGAGYVDNGPPGERPIYHAGYYGAFVLDPDGNNVELVNHNR